MSIKSKILSAIVLLLSFTIQVHAAVVCPTGSGDTTKGVTIEDIKATPKLITTNKQKKSKSSSDYFGMFKMLMPNTSK